MVAGALIAAVLFCSGGVLVFASALFVWAQSSECTPFLSWPDFPASSEHLIPKDSLIFLSPLRSLSCTVSRHGQRLLRGDDGADGANPGARYRGRHPRQRADAGIQGGTGVLPVGAAGS